MDELNREQGRPALWLGLATVLGAALALGATLEPAQPASNVAATVNGQAIERAEFERALAAMDADKRSPLTEADRQRVIDRLVEEELLIQRAIEIGLVDRDRAVRSALVNAMIAHILANASDQQTSTEMLANWYVDNQDLFTPPPYLHIQRRSVSQSDIAGQSVLAEAVATGQSAEALNGFQPTSALPLPEGLLPAAKWQDYLGGDLVRTLLPIPVGNWHGPVREGDEIAYYYVAARQTAPPPAFDPDNQAIRQAYDRARDDVAFREYLDWLEQRGRVERHVP